MDSMNRPAGKSFSSSIHHWLQSFLPAANQISVVERLRSSIGALVGIAVTGLITHLVLGQTSDLPLLVAPMGASAVLLFGVPASPLAQPWSLFGGNLISALVGVSCARWIADPVAAASVAVALSIALMFSFRCVHPPSGAVALTAVLGGPAIHALGYQFVWFPIGLNSLVLLASAIIYHGLTRHRYPHHATVKAPGAGTAHPAFTRADLDSVLNRKDEMLDIDVGDLETVLGEVEARAYSRYMGELDCAGVMTTQVQNVRPETSVAQAWELLQRHKIKALPVLDGMRRVAGIVTQMDFIHHAALPPFAAGTGLRVADIMSAAVKTVRASQQLADLVPLFADCGHHHLPVVGDNGELVGMITQADLVTGLHRRALLSA
ncbi:MAG: HPP family protein [Pseudomonadota bacterium]